MIERVVKLTEEVAVLQERYIIIIIILITDLHNLLNREEKSLMKERL